MLISVARRLFLRHSVSAIAGVAALPALIKPARAQVPDVRSGVADKLTPGPSGIEFLDYEPKRRWAAGSRVGDIAYLAGVTARHPVTGQGVNGTVEEQTELVCQNIQAALKAFGTDFAHVFKVTQYLLNWDDIGPMSGVCARYIKRAIPSSTVVVARLSEPYFRIEIDAMALIPKRS